MLKVVLTDTIHAITKAKKPDIDSCFEIIGYAKMKKDGKPLFGPFHAMLEDIIIENPLLRQLRGNQND